MEVKLNSFKTFNKSLKWLKENSFPSGGVNVTNKKSFPYPEVSGYLIPSLLAWGEKELAFQYGNWLKSIQNDDGSFFDPYKKAKCLFDTGQVLKGFIALNEVDSEGNFYSPIERSLNWINSQLDEEGNVTCDDFRVWGNHVPVGVLMYSLEAFLRASVILKQYNIESKIRKTITKFLNNQKLEDFQNLSHFHAYILESLVDLGYTERALRSLEGITGNRKKLIRSYPGKRWYCSVALFQYAVVLYKLGEKDFGDRFFSKAVSFQNRSGGWFGSYGFVIRFLEKLGKYLPLFRYYFAKEEISWTNKFFLDALYLKLELEFDIMHTSFSNTIDSTDGRYQFVLSKILESKPSKILDLGCGKGRYLRNLLIDYPSGKYCAVDISEKVMEEIPNNVEKKKGNCLNIPYFKDNFDFVMVIETLEHAVNITAAVTEIYRVLKVGGSAIIIDKNASKQKYFRIPDWETWFDSAQLSLILEQVGFKVSVIKNISYENRRDGLFTAWIATK